MKLLFWKRPPHVFRPEIELDNVFLQRIALDLSSPYVEWTARWTHALGICYFYGCEIEPLRIGHPAKKRHIARLEKKRKMQLPTPLRAFFLNVGKSVSFSWQNPNWTLDFNDGEHIENPGGRLQIQLRNIIPVTQLEGWNPETWSKEEVSALGENADEIRALLENAIAFMPVGNGDHLVIDTRDDAVRYLSHDDPEAMGMILGRSFDDFMDAWSRLGCIGPEIWQLQFFLGPFGLDPESVNSQAFQVWLS